MADDLRQCALQCLLITDPLEKVEQTQLLYQRWLAGELIISDDNLSVPDEPGRPDKPVLVAPHDLPRRRNSAESGNASLLHAITHIEFNAINLGWDAIARFSGLPRQFYDDWARVAFEESQHFTLLREHLLSLGYDYGDFPAHSGMWDMARKTHHDPLIRM
ncbi:MAG TPA: ferritin-like domain-containing protein, partial [Methylophaga sp.]|nr:ferritin-like domain-containing protein [Methylophaga sp.]